MPVASGRSVRREGAEMLELPEGVGFGEGVELALVRTGDVLTVTPASDPRVVKGNSNLQQLLRDLESLPAPSCVEVRDEEIIPEPRGL